MPYYPPEPNKQDRNPSSGKENRPEPKIPNAQPDPKTLAAKWEPKPRTVQPDPKAPNAQPESKASAANSDPKTPAAESGRYRRQRKNARSVTQVAVLCVSLLLAGYGCVQLISYGADWAASRRTTEELRQVMAESETLAPEAGEGDASALPTDAPVFPTEATAISGDASVPSGDASALPTDASALPTEASALPTDASSLPTYATALSTALPAEDMSGTKMEKAEKGETLPAVSYPDNPNLTVNARFANLRKKSGYIIGWITIDKVDEPVVYRDNTFFLTHDALGKKNANGALFLDQGISLLTRPYTLLVYGHNMKSGAMFGDLRKFEKSSYLYQHQVFSFDTLYEDGQYAVFAVANISLIRGTNHFVDLSAIQSPKREARLREMKALSAASMVDVPLDVNEEDQLLLLITCVGDDNQRLVVAARRLRDGEHPDGLTLRSR